MTPRERWLVAALGLALAALPAGALWQQARWEDAHEAVRAALRLEERLPAPDPEESARLQRVRAEVRELLERGDFPRALRRLEAAGLLRESEDLLPAVAGKGRGVGLEELWPSGSPARVQARRVLEELARKQREGYDLQPALEALIRVADAARAGKRKEALAAFREVERLVRNAPLRPGFRPAAAVEVPPIPPDVAAEQMRRFLRMARMALPQMMAASPQAPLLRRVEPLIGKMDAALREGKDIRPLLPVLQELGRAVRAGDPAGVERLARRAEALLRSLPQAPGASPATAAATGALPGPPPVLPSPAELHLPGGAQRARAEEVLRALDLLRRLPEPAYRARREQLAALLGRLLAGVRPEPPPERIALGAGNGLEIELGSQGEVVRVRLEGQDWSAGVPAGGLYRVAADGRETAVRGAVSRSPDGAALEAGGVSVVWKREGEGLVLRLQTRAATDAPERLLVRLPLRVAGWRWCPTGENAGTVIAADERYAAGADPSSGAPLAVTLRGPDGDLTLAATGAASLACEPRLARLEVSFPATAGAAELSLRLSAAPRNRKPELESPR